MMSQLILDLCWLPFFSHKDPYRIKFSRFYLLWGVRYQHLCDFSHFQKCDNYVITPSNVLEFFQNSNLSEPGQKYPHMPKISPGGLPVSSINSVHINIYIYIYFNCVLIVRALRSRSLRDGSLPHKGGVLLIISYLKSAQSITPYSR